MTPESEQAETRKPEQIRDEIEDTREELGDTVAALAKKSDIRAQARKRARRSERDREAQAL